MKKHFQSIPWILLYSRLITGIVFLIFGIIPELYYNNAGLVLFLFSFGFIGDIFDGIIARYLKMDTTLMRRLDSLFDVFFWLTSTYLLYMQGSELQRIISIGVGSILVVVLLEYLVSIFRFSRPPSSHNLLSKFFGLLLFSFYIMAFLGKIPIIYGIIVFTLGFIARTDSLLIYLVIREWTHDVPSFLQAISIRKGKQIKKHKLFHSEHSDEK